MPYLGHLLNSKVQDSADAVIGRLKDILIIPKAGKYDALEFLAVKTNRPKKVIYIPYEYVENLSRKEISLKNTFSNVNYSEAIGDSYTFLKRDILDQQIVDMEGARVVRVNDLRLGPVNGKMSVIGVDISGQGLLRRLGVEKWNFLSPFKVHLIDWRETQPVKGVLKLDIGSKDLNRLHPADLANIIEDLNIKQGSQLVTSLDAKRAAKVFEEVDPRLQKNMVKFLSPEQVTKILSQMSIDEVVDLMKTLSKEEVKTYLSQLQSGVAQEVESLISYPDDTAGGLMSLDYMTVRPEWTVKQTIEEIKLASPKFRSILYIYVTDVDQHFYGAVSLRRLIISEPEKNLKELLKLFPATSILKPNQKFTEIVDIMTKYNLFTAVVLDKKRRLLGVVYIDDVMRTFAPQA
ncbi:MAG: CBS domain-containing protein [Candidatus Buchananbacteria bacterium]|jgi:sporulation protein YlmC with PRC-barrel domain